MIKEIVNIDGSVIEIEELVRPTSNRVIGYGTWLTQGSEENPTEYYIGYHDLDLYIKGLQKAQAEIKTLMDKRENDSN